MSLAVAPPVPSELPAVLEALASWQRDGLPVQLHPGDLGWHWRFGAETLAGCLQVWREGDEIVAVGFVDGGSLVRLALSPERGDDEVAAARVADDLHDPARGILTAPGATAEVRYGPALRHRLSGLGWEADESWTPLVRDLGVPVELPALGVEVAGAEQAGEVTAVLRSAFAGSTATPDRFHVMVGSPAYAHGRTLLGREPDGRAVGLVTVWSAGPGRPGLLEPLAVRASARGRGYGRAMALAAARALHEMGASSALVAAPTDNVGAVRTYAAAGFVSQGESTDLRRPH